VRYQVITAGKYEGDCLFQDVAPYNLVETDISEDDGGSKLL
jgi:hypothetical protein